MAAVTGASNAAAAMCAAVLVKAAEDRAGEVDPSLIASNSVGQHQTARRRLSLSKWRACISRSPNRAPRQHRLQQASRPLRSASCASLQLKSTLSIYQVNEVRLCLKDLGPTASPIFAEEMLNAVIDKKDKDRVHLEQLMVEIVGDTKSKEGAVISVRDWASGLESVVELIDDIKIDVPKCDEWLGKVGRLLTNNCISIRVLEPTLKVLKNDCLAMFTWGLIQVHGDAAGSAASKTHLSPRLPGLLQMPASLGQVPTSQRWRRGAHVEGSYTELVYCSSKK